MPAAAVLALPVSAHGATAPTVAQMLDAAAAARRLERVLDDSGAEIAVIARVGSDLSRYGITWTHAGIVWRDDPAGRWQVWHALNDGEGATSRLYRQGLMNFFLDDPLHYAALVLVPGPKLQAGLVARLRAGTAADLHQPRYNAVAYPFATAYQNSNQFVLENLALARAGLVDGNRAEAIAELQHSGFHPHRVRLSAVERLGSALRANVHFDDHPVADINRYAVVTVESVERWLVTNGELRQRIEVE